MWPTMKGTSFPHLCATPARLVTGTACAVQLAHAVPSPHGPSPAGTLLQLCQAGSHPGRIPPPASTAAELQHLAHGHGAAEMLGEGVWLREPPEGLCVLVTLPSAAHLAQPTLTQPLSPCSAEPAEDRDLGEHPGQTPQPGRTTHCHHAPRWITTFGTTGDGYLWGRGWGQAPYGSVLPSETR